MESDNRPIQRINEWWIFILSVSGTTRCQNYQITIPLKLSNTSSKLLIHVNTKFQLFDGILLSRFHYRIYIRLKPRNKIRQVKEIQILRKRNIVFEPESQINTNNANTCIIRRIKFSLVMRMSLWNVEQDSWNVEQDCRRDESGRVICVIISLLIF